MIQDTINGKKFWGQYMGVVRRHLFNGKCKVWVPGVYEHEYADKPEMLPDAEQASPIFAGGAAGNGVFSYPNLGAAVWVFFKNGDQNYPVYWAIVNAGPQAIAQYQDVTQGLVATSDTKPSAVHKINCGHCFILVYESGAIEIQAADANGGTKAKVFMKDDGTMEISSDKQISISAPSVKITGKEQLDIAAGSCTVSTDKTSVVSDVMTLYTGNFEKTVTNALGEIPGQ